MTDLSERFWVKAAPPDENGCRLWTAAKNARGYGKIGVDRKTVWAHRLAYELAIGPIPEGLVIDHLCRTPSCVTPEHLEAVTRWENTRRGTGPFAQRANRPTCLRGHEFSGLDRHGRRYCRRCDIDQHREAAARRRQERRIQ